MRQLANQKKNWFWEGCKPNFVCALRRRESFVLATNTRNPSAFAEMERAAPGFPIWPCTRWGFPCRVACASRGALLPHLFTITAGLRRRLFIFCGTVRQLASRPSCLRVSPVKTRVTQHRALRCSDFPPPACAGSDPPPCQNHPHSTGSPTASQAKARPKAQTSR